MNSFEKKLVLSIVKLSRYTLYISLALVVCIIMLIIVYQSSSASQNLLYGSTLADDALQSQSATPTPEPAVSSAPGSVNTGQVVKTNIARLIPAGS